MAGYDAVTGHHLTRHAEVAAAVRHELVDLLEAARVEQQVHPLARGQLSALTLLAEALFTAAELGAASSLQIGG